MGKTYIYGAGGHASVVAGTALLHGYEIAGFLDDFSHEPERRFLEKPVYSSAVLEEGDTVFLGLGNNLRRQEIALDLLKRGVILPALIHPTASISEFAEVGCGSYIGANAVVDPLCRIGRFSILNNGALVCHQTVIGEAANLCPGIKIAGNSEIGDRVWLGIGSVVIEKIRIAPDVFLGAGSVVVKDITEENSLYFGVPAKRQDREKTV